MTLRHIAALAAALTLMLSCASCEKKAKEAQLSAVPLRTNLIQNPSFEEWNGQVPLHWNLESFEGTPGRMNLYGRDDTEKSSGGSSFFLRGVFDVTQWMVLVQRHPVIPGYRLSFSAAMKGRNLFKSKGQETRANIYVRFYDANGKRVSDRGYADAFTPALQGTRDWQRYGRAVDIPKEARSAEIGLINELTGYVFFDDVEFIIDAPIPWKKVETKYVDFYYLEAHPLPEEAIKKESEFVESCVKRLDVKVQGKVGYYYFGSEEEMQKLLGTRSGHDRAVWKERKFYTTKTFEDHEIIHMLLIDLGYPPLGLAEGVVYYLLGSWEGKDIHMLAKDLLIRRSVPALHSTLKQEELNAAGLSNVVPAWSSFTIYLIDRYGAGKFMKLYSDANNVFEADAFDKVFSGIYGKDLDVMDREWRLWVLRYQPKR